jgi:hypothetical protein
MTKINWPLLIQLFANKNHLPDATIVYPAHGAGSACGKNMSKETVSTIGNQKGNDYALRANMTEAEFVKEVTDGYCLLRPTLG